MTGTSRRATRPFPCAARAPLEDDPDPIEVIGGHSLDDAEPKFGLVVTGRVHPDRVFRNDTARPGDVLVLTKPIGTGVLTTAIKRGRLADELVREAVRTMATLNRQAAEALAPLTVHACTDVTGFGLLGHLSEVVAGSRVAARVHVGDIPFLPRARALAAEGVLPGGSRRNRAAVAPLTDVAAGVAESDVLLLADAQTSGGLLVALPEPDAVRFLDSLRAIGYDLAAAVIGEVVGEAGEGRIEVLP